jgi:hypothetical protein
MMVFKRAKKRSVVDVVIAGLARSWRQERDNDRRLKRRRLSGRRR